MVRSLLIRGMLVGVLAGLLSFGVARVFGEPQVDAAIAFEESHADEAGGPAKGAPANMSMAPAPRPVNSPDHADAAGVPTHEHEVELVSRQTQSTWGLLTGVLVNGVAIGGLFALTFAFAQGRIGSPSLSPRATAGLIAIAGFAAVVLVPQLKYPANPPAVGNPETIGSRTALYFIMIAFSILVLVAAWGSANRLSASLGRWNANLLAILAYVAVMAVAMLILPGVNEVPTDFSASVLWQFRIASIGLHAVSWATLGIVFGILAQRLMAPESRRA